MLQWEDCGSVKSEIKLGFLEISCTRSIRGSYKDGSHQYMIYLRVPNADSKEIITLAKVRGQLADAKAEAEKWVKNLARAIMN